MLASEEARELSDRETGSQHLLLGILQAAGDDLTNVFNGYGLTADIVRARLAENCTGDQSFDEDADALSAIGIDLRAVRDSVARTFGLMPSTRRCRVRVVGAVRRGHMSLSHGAKKVLELSLREALAHKDNEIRCEHLLLGILRSGDKAAIDLITEHVYTAQLRAAVVKLLDQAA